MSVVIPEADNLANTAMFALLRLVFRVLRTAPYRHLERFVPESPEDMWLTLPITD